MSFVGFLTIIEVGNLYVFGTISSFYELNDLLGRKKEEWVTLFRMISLAITEFPFKKREIEFLGLFVQLRDIQEFSVVKYVAPTLFCLYVGGMSPL